jgi:MipA family protein
MLLFALFARFNQALRLAFFSLVFPLCLACAASAQTAPVAAKLGSQPLWELGLGVGGLSMPQYRGSDQNLKWVLPVPYVAYRGDFFRSDSEGTRAVLLDSEGLDVDVSVDGTPPVKSKDSRARTGMRDLAATLEIGPNVNVVLAKGSFWKAELRVPFRAAFTAERNPQAIGWTLTPALNLDLQLSGWDVGLQGGPVAASRSFHRYFYGVDAASATLGRPIYSAASGFGGYYLTAAASRRWGDVYLASYVRLDNVSGARFEASPLVKQRSNMQAGLVLSWVFKASEARAPERR